MTGNQRWRERLSIVVVGGAGFIGRRLMPILEKQGADIVCMDVNPGAASFGERVKMVRGDVTQFDDAPLRQRVLEIINDIRKDAGQAPLKIA